MIAEIVPLARLPKSLSYFDYEVPQDIEGQIKIGQLVKIPFRGRRVSGLVIKLKEKPAEIKTSLKSIIKVLSPNSQLNSDQFKLLWWMSDHYLVSPALILKNLIPEPPMRVGKFKIKSEIKPISLSILESDVSGIQENLKSFFVSSKKIFLFRCRNPKNKIAFYLKSASQILKQGQRVLILEPQILDISLILPYFLHLFSGKIAVLHSGLSKTEYWQEWQKIKDNKLDIIVGSRSAIFAPIQNLGLVIINDEEAPDFKQSDQNPYYDARTVALKLAEFTGVKVLLASEAPRVETYHLVKEKKCELLVETNSKPFNQPIFIDMDQELKNKNFLSLSNVLQEAVQKTLDRHKKVALLLNRRGASTLMFCSDCDYIFRCPNCEIPLVCHEDERKLTKFVCHKCGQESPSRLTCPNCHGTSIKFFGTGTQTVEREVRKIFFESKVTRIDKDAKILNSPPKADPPLADRFQISDSDIYIGTQFFIRNYLHRIKNLGLIGVISTDTLLFRPDFRSGEKTYQWLTKIINFGNQTKNPVLIQTFFPNNFVVQAILSQNYESFYNQEAEERKKFGYPPFGRLVKLVYSHKNEKKCAFENMNLFKNLNSAFGKDIEILHDEKLRKVRQKFLATMVIKLSEELIYRVISFLKNVPDGWTIDMDPESII